MSNADIKDIQQTQKIADEIMDNVTPEQADAIAKINEHLNNMGIKHEENQFNLAASQAHVNASAVKYPLDSALVKALSKDFSNNPGTLEQLSRKQKITQILFNSSIEIAQLVPRCVEFGMLLGKIEEAEMWAHAAIARNE